MRIEEFMDVRLRADEPDYKSGKTSTTKIEEPYSIEGITQKIKCATIKTTTTSVIPVWSDSESDVSEPNSPIDN